MLRARRKTAVSRKIYGTVHKIGLLLIYCGTRTILALGSTHCMRCAIGSLDCLVTYSLFANQSWFSSTLVV